MLKRIALIVLVAALSASQIGCASLTEARGRMERVKEIYVQQRAVYDAQKQVIEAGAQWAIAHQDEFSDTQWDRLVSSYVALQEGARALEEFDAKAIRTYASYEEVTAKLSDVVTILKTAAVLIKGP